MGPSRDSVGGALGSPWVLAAGPLPVCASDPPVSGSPGTLGECSRRGGPTPGSCTHVGGLCGGVRVSVCHTHTHTPYRGQAFWRSADPLSTGR